MSIAVILWTVGAIFIAVVLVVIIAKLFSLSDKEKNNQNRKNAEKSRFLTQAKQNMEKAKKGLYCTHCGALLKEDSKKCQSCGAIRNNEK